MKGHCEKVPWQSDSSLTHVLLLGLPVLLLVSSSHVPIFGQTKKHPRPLNIHPFKTLLLKKCVTVSAWVLSTDLLYFLTRKSLQMLMVCDFSVLVVLANSQLAKSDSAMESFLS